MPQDDHDLRGVLRGEADRHHPDRAAMLERIERGRSRARPPTALHRFLVQPFEGLHRPGGLVRPVAAAVAVAALLVAGVTGVRRADPPATPAAAPATPGQRFSAPVGPALVATGRRDSHSFENWSQEQLTITTTEQVTALDVTIRIARTEGVADTGHWTSIPSGMVTTAATSDRKALVYRFRLRPGARLAPGSYVFAAQFNHAARPRALSEDTWTATTTASQKSTVTGDFSG